MGNNELQMFTPENLAKAICKVISGSYEMLLRDVNNYIIPRLDFLAGVNNIKAPFFYFEESYVETEWKDMLAVHYVNTSYQVSNNVLRVHLFKKAHIAENEYLGCFTMRNIDETQIMLSYIYPNWEKIKFGNKPLNVMTYPKRVHIDGVEIRFCTYPLFVQDNAVVTCAQVCLVSMSKYLHSKYDYSKIRVGNLDNSYYFNKTKIYPSSGLDARQMLEVLYNHNIPVEYWTYESKGEELREYIDYCVESALPVLVGIRFEEENEIVGHVIQIIGHSDITYGRRYVVYDDSGAYLKCLKEEEAEEKVVNRNAEGFVKCICWEQLQKYLEKYGGFIIYPIHEKVYMFYDDFKKHIRDIVTEELQNNNSRRILIADNREIKRFLYDNIVCNKEKISAMREEAQRLLKINMPHYLWCCEYATKLGNVLYIANPTYNRITTKNIFLNKEPLISKKQISLLRYE